VAVPSASAQLAPFCAPETAPSLEFKFAELKLQLGSGMGQPVDCEHTDPISGDRLQQTTTGLAFYHQSTNIATFTDGDNHWAVVSDELEFWTGDRTEPSTDAVVFTPEMCQPVPDQSDDPLAQGCFVLLTYRLKDGSPLLHNQ
jgi:hypothetical protein